MLGAVKTNAESDAVLWFSSPSSQTKRREEGLEKFNCKCHSIGNETGSFQVSAWIVDLEAVLERHLVDLNVKRSEFWGQRPIALNRVLEKFSHSSGVTRVFEY